MPIFWILIAVVAALASLLVFAGARRGVDGTDDVEPESATRELAELDRLKSRGLLTDDSWVAARAEAGRRLLTTRTARIVFTTRPSDVRWVLAGLGVTGTIALGLYAWIGSPGLNDQTYASRVEGWATSTDTLEPEQVAAVLTREAQMNPEDPRVLSMLGAARFQAGDSVGAASAFRRVLAIRPDDAQSWSRLGESLVRSQDGVVGTDAEAAFMEAVKRDPGQLGALYFLGEAALRRGDVAGVTVLWTPLIGALDPADPRRAELQGRLDALQRAAASAPTNTPPSGAAR